MLVACSLLLGARTSRTRVVSCLSSANGLVRIARWRSYAQWSGPRSSTQILIIFWVFKFEHLLILPLLCLEPAAVSWTGSGLY